MGGSADTSSPGEHRERMVKGAKEQGEVAGTEVQAVIERAADVGVIINSSYDMRYRRAVESRPARKEKEGEGGKWRANICFFASAKQQRGKRGNGWILIVVSVEDIQARTFHVSLLEPTCRSGNEAMA